MEVLSIHLKDIIKVSSSETIDLAKTLRAIQLAADAAKFPGDFNILLDFKDAVLQTYPENELHEVISAIYEEFMCPKHRFAFRNKIALIVPPPISERKGPRCLTTNLQRDGLDIGLYDETDTALLWLNRGTVPLATALS